MDIKKILEDRFNAELEDFYDRRIIFWQDPEKEFSYQNSTKIYKLQLCRKKIASQ